MRWRSPRAHLRHSSWSGRQDLRQTLVWPSALLLLVSSAVRADPGTGGVSTTSQNRIAVVIDYMEDLHTTIMDQEREEAVNYKCLMEWCASEIKVTGQEIKQVEMALDDKGASIKEVDADIAKYTQMIKENQEETTEVSDSVEQANNIRTEESDKYEQDKSLNDQSVRQ
eukprot:1157729-Amphidinium_carterae.1